MSLFQCDKCGCRENTSCSNAAHPYFINHSADKNPRNAAAMDSARERLDLKSGESFGAYCSACSPFWFTEARDLGVGENPNPTTKCGLWHGRFPRTYYPLGLMETDRVGNLSPKKTTAGKA